MSETSEREAGDPRVRLEQLLRGWLDEDDAVTVVQIVLAQGWVPPGMRLTVSNNDVRKGEALATESATCPNCGIPTRWCHAVTSNPDRCWRWDYEQFDTTAAELAATREQNTLRVRDLQAASERVLLAERQAEKLREALRPIIHEYNLWSEDANDGEFRLWDLDRLCVAIVAARAALADGEGEA